MLSFTCLSPRLTESTTDNIIMWKPPATQTIRPMKRGVPHQAYLQRLTRSQEVLAAEYTRKREIQAEMLYH